MPDRLWYVKRHTTIKGPFPAAAIERAIALGRIVESDEMSTDGETWSPANEYPAFEHHRHAAESTVHERRFDERQGNRRQALAVPVVDTRSGADRRTPESAPTIRRRETARRIWTGLQPRRGSVSRVACWRRIQNSRAVVS